MKKIINIFSILALSLLVFSCKMETPEESGSIVRPGEPAHITIPFYCGGSSSVDIKTKVTVGDDYEGKIYNLYVGIYNDESELMYNMFYDLYTDGWSYTQNGQTSQGEGEVDLSTYQGNDCSIYMVANISTSMYNLNADKLKLVGTTEAGLRAMIAKLNQNIISRDGFFLMTGWLKHVNISENMVISNERTTNSDGDSGVGTDLHLNRLDAKITFNVTCAKPDDPTTQPTIESFNPTGWRIVNVPLRAYLMEAGNDANYFGSNPDNYSNPEYYRIFHNTPTTDPEGYDTNTFSFYLTESKLEAKHPITTYRERELQEKDEYGYNGAFVNAPDYATYVVIDGELMMQDTDYNPVTGVLVKTGRTLSANVQYKIHLGNMGADMSDFKVLRNHDYKYNVTIKGVDNITIEVITSDNSKTAGGTPEDAVENTPGATGEVTLALEKFVNVDAHYSTFVHSFVADNVDAALTWYVSTPFSKGAAINNPADYKWITFRVNELGTDGKYKMNRRLFKPYDETATFDMDALYNGAEGSATASPGMSVKELTAYLKAQKVRRAAGQSNAFDSEGKMAITMFVDEYYYDKDPRDGTVSGDLWKKFTGSAVSPRIMHILSKTMESYDEESYVIASTISIKQKTIQTVYSTQSSISRAWGVEQVDETKVTPAMGWRSNSSSAAARNTRRTAVDYVNNNKGRLNNVREWGVYNGSNWVTNLRWDTFMNLTSADENSFIPDMKTDYNYIAYQCMSRNRDNDGDGIIDPDEMRWYLIAHNQVNALWTGDMSVTSAARFYNPPADDIYVHYPTSSVIVSTGSSNTQCLMVWAEEYGATGVLYGDHPAQASKYGYHVRCVRDFNTDLTGNPASDAANPEPLITATGSNAAGWTFDLSNLAPENFRESRSTELIYGSDQNPVNNRISVKFMTAPVASQPTYNAVTFQELNNDDRVGVGKYNPYCPEGYRLPNNRELLLMFGYLPLNYWSHSEGSSHHAFISRTWWTLGILGNNKGNTSATTGGQRVSIGVDEDGLRITTQPVSGNFTLSSTVARCVKDVYEVSIDD